MSYHVSFHSETKDTINRDNLYLSRLFLSGSKLYDINHDNVYYTRSRKKMMNFSNLTEKSDFLKNLLNRTNAKTIKELKSGGSPAGVLHVTTHIGEEMVVKYMSKEDGLVDGHDIDTFRLKVSQIKKIQDELPLLGSYYPKILYDYNDELFAFYCTPFYTGYEVTSHINQNPYDLNFFFNDLSHIVNVMVDMGYDKVLVDPWNGYFESVYINRVLRRFWLLEKYLPQDVIYTNNIVINGRACHSASILLRKLANNKKLLRQLQPQSLSFPVHGDANLGNFIITQGSMTKELKRDNFSFKIIDPRGTLDYWDPMYDFAKMLFSLSLFDNAMKHGFVIERKRNDKTHYTVNLDKILSRGYIEAANLFLEFLNPIISCKQFLESRPYQWKRRLLFSHAIHVLAESACRLSDRKERNLPHRQDSSIYVDLALGFYLAGTLLLNELLEFNKYDEIPDISTHLSSFY